MRTITADYVRQYLEILIDEITEIREPVRIEGEKKKAVVMVRAEDFESFLRSDDSKTLISGGKKSVKSLFGILKHRSPDIPVSLEKWKWLLRKDEAKE